MGWQHSKYGVLASPPSEVPHVLSILTLLIAANQFWWPPMTHKLTFPTLDSRRICSQEVGGLSGESEKHPDLMCSRLSSPTRLLPQPDAQAKLPSIPVDLLYLLHYINTNDFYWFWKKKSPRIWPPTAYCPTPRQPSHCSMCCWTPPLRLVPALVASACSEPRSQHQQCTRWCSACFQLRYGFLLTHPAAMTLSSVWPAAHVRHAHTQAFAITVPLATQQLLQCLCLVVSEWSSSQPSSPRPD